MASIHIKQLLFWEKSNLVHVRLWLYAETIFLLQATLPWFICCSPPFYVLYYICNTKRAQLSLFNHYLPILTQNSFFLFPFAPFPFPLLSFSLLFFPSISTFYETLFAREPPSNATSELNRGLHFHFVERIKTSKLRARFNVVRLCVNQFHKWIIISNTVPARIIADVMTSKGSVSLKPLELTMFATLLIPVFIRFSRNSLSGTEILHHCCHSCRSNPRMC